MILRKLARYIRNFEWFAVIIELIVVTVGLLMAFQLDRWREEHVHRQQEVEYVQRLIRDVSVDIPAIEFAIERQELRLDLVELLMEVSHNPSTALKRPGEFLAAVDQAAYTFTPTLASHTYEDLRSTGNISLILDQEMKSLLFEYYGSDQESRQWKPLRLSVEIRHFELSAGILTHEQSIFIHDQWRVLHPDGREKINEANLASEAILATAERLRNNPETIAWLPQVRGMQTSLFEEHNARLKRAKSLLEALKLYAKRLN